MNIKITLDQLNSAIKAKEFETGKISDGYHTFDELYEHRIVLFTTLCKKIKSFKHLQIWKSKLHHDGTSFEGWFIMGIGKEKGKQISYHLPIQWWKNTGYAEELERAPEFDGHTPKDVLKRLKCL